MSLLQAYLHSPKTRRVLSRKPGEKGFSLIELVVVVAVLAVLAAIAIPSFTSISEKARASAASNTVAQIAKECATKIADTGSGNYNVPSLDGYRDTATPATFGWTYNGSVVTAAATACPTTGTIGMTSGNTGQYPSFFYDVSSGKKTCTATSADAQSRGCPTNGGPW